MLRRYLDAEREVIVISGGARGADALAHEVAEQLGMETEVHVAEWYRYGRQAGPIRNDHMVSLGADVCLAFPLGRSVGTRHCMAAAEAAGIPVTNLGDQ